jgi:RNA polymerase sigma-70 factor (ECF subfamily)
MSSSREATVPDTSLVARIRAGDVAAFEAMFRMHGTAVLRFAASFVHDADLAEDLMQDVFGWVWTHRAEWSPAGSTLVYLLGAVRNRALNLSRNAKRRDDVATQYAQHGESPGMSAPERTPDMVFDQHDLRIRMRAVLAALPEQRRTLLVLRWYHGMDWPEIAGVLGVSVGAAKMQHHRALTALRERVPEALE